MDRKPRPGSRLTPIDQAYTDLLASLPTISDEERVPLRQALGRVLSRDLISAIDVPPHANSAMDGYAVRASDVQQSPTLLTVTQRIAAGQTGRALGAGEAARIFTGAPLPPGADAVVMQENCECQGEALTVLQSVRPEENIRHAGEDIRAGAVLLTAGHRLRPQDIGLAASTGAEELSVRRRLRVAVMVTGDELVPPGTSLKPGQIYNSNMFSMVALLQQLGVQVEELGIVEDDLDVTIDVLKGAAARADCIICTGGVSVGEEDHVKAAVEANGHLDLWKLAIKPGKPFASGKVATTQFFGLPGNPVSAFVTFLLLVKPCLLAMQGGEVPTAQAFSMEAAFDCDSTGERQEYRRVLLERGESGRTRLQLFDNQSSGVGASLSAADGLAIIPPYTAVKAGDSLQFLPFSELLT